MSCVTVFGGTGFVGRRVVHHLRESGATVRIASRHPGQADGDDVEQIRADAHDERSVEAAVAGADGVVNAISLYVEHGSDTFHSVHVEAAARIASVARRVGAKRLVHISGIGADAASPSPYIRSRGEGEAAVQAAFPGVVIIRPAVMFASGRRFSHDNSQAASESCRLIRYSATAGRGSSRRTRMTLLRRLHKSCGRTKSRIPSMNWPARVSIHTRSWCGPLPETAGLRPVLMRVPFAFWDALAGSLKFCRIAPLTRNQVELMQIDTTASDNLPGFRELGISPRSLEEELEAMLKQSK